MGWGIVKPPLWLFLRRFLTRCETMTWHSARAAESVLRQGNRSEEMKRDFFPAALGSGECQFVAGFPAACCYYASCRWAGVTHPSGVCVWAPMCFILHQTKLCWSSPQFPQSGSVIERERETAYKKKVHTDRWRAAAGKSFWKTDGSSRKPAATVLYQSRLLSLQELLPECADRVPKCVPVAQGVMHLILWGAIPGLFGALLGEMYNVTFLTILALRVSLIHWFSKCFVKSVKQKNK